MVSVRRIISGGQTGADRGGLDFALERGIPHGGFCPKGRLAEDGVIPAKYELEETGSRQYPERTRRNVELADATLVFASGKTLSRGSALTVRYSRSAHKPVVVLNGFPNVAADAARLGEFLELHRPEVLNVAGNRESTTPGMRDHVAAVLAAVWTA